MDPESKRLLEETRTLVRENHRLLNAMRRHQIYGLIGTILIWAIVLALPLYLYQKYLQPFVNSFSAAIGLSSEGLPGLPTSAELQKLIDSYKAGR